MRPNKIQDMSMPKFVEEGWDYFDEETKEWKLKPNAPDWAKREFEEFHSTMNAKSDENGIITNY